MKSTTRYQRDSVTPVSSSQRGSSIYSAESRDDDVSSYGPDRIEPCRWETRQGSPQSNNDYGIELVLSTTTDKTTDTERARDMMIPATSRRYKQHNNKGRGGVVATTGRYTNQRSMSSLTEEPSGIGTHMESLFLPDEASETTSHSSGIKRTRKSRLRNNTEVLDDDPWRAAKRGDLAALKRFHREGETDWSAEDQFHNIPLYYACQSGANVDINVVHFLLWVTPIAGKGILAKCKNRKNDAVMRILNDFLAASYSSPFLTRRRDDMSEVPVLGPLQFKGTTAAAKMEAPAQMHEPLDDQETRARISSALSGSQPSAIPTKSRNGSNLSTSLPPRPRSAGRARNSRFMSEQDLADDSSLQAIVDDVNKIRVTPSTITNMTINEDDWSMGSIFSFGKSRQEKAAQHGKSKSRGTFEKQPSNHFQEASKLVSNTNDRTPSVGGRERKSEKSMEPAIPVSRKVTFDNHKETKTLSPKLGQVSFRRSPREKSSITGRSDDSNPPKIEFEDKELRWIIQNHIATESSANSNVVLTIHVRDAKERVLIQNCHGVSVQIHGRKIKSLLVCDCSDISVVFDTVTHACEIVQCKSAAIQTTGICPAFTIDKSKRVTVWLSQESMKISNLVTSKCTEVAVSLPKGQIENDYDRTELPLPERYVHHFSEGEVKSRVSSICR